MGNKTRESQEAIFRKLYNENKGTPLAVSSESWEHKKIRFENISGIFEHEEQVEVHDVGMGLAALYEYIKEQYPNKTINYSGTEILPEYVEEAKAKFPECNFLCRDVAEQSFDDRHDYVVLSGVFHQRRDSKIPDWERFSQSILSNAFEMAKKGIAFNFISPFVDFYQEQVYYCNLPKLLYFINDNLSRFFTIKHDYALFEFTVYVYKEEYVKTKHTQQEFSKYFKV